jgi:2,4-dienoyl-CoA reductase-like NADH-dependent reductase (Old Yellow Enzyme family)
MAGENKRRILQRDPNPHLFRPLTMRSVTARNRIMLSPMCEYSAVDGVPGDWHLVHLGARATGGAGIVCTEVAHVEARGRITPGCLGLWNDEQRDALARIAAFVAERGAVPAIQLGHAGRKASITRPWEGNSPLSPEQDGWEVIGPSAIPYAEGFPVPIVMDRSIMDEVTDAYGAAARRSREAGFKILEVHAAHGYLGHEFLSPLSNRRDDDYGGTLENRARHLMRVLDAVRAEWPDDLPLFVRLSMTEWVEDGYDIEQSIALCRMLEARGDVDLIDCSSGGNHPGQVIPTHPGYQVPFAERVKRDTGLLAGAVGLIHSPDLAEEILANGHADLVIMGRALMANPHWPLQAAKTLKAENVDWPVQYERSNIF